MLITVTHPAAITGTMTFADGALVLNFVSGIATADVDPTFLGMITNAGLTFTPGGGGPLTNYDPGLDIAVGALVTNAAPISTAALRAASVLPKAGSYTYNPDGTVATGPDGESYAYNTDGTLHSVTLNGVTRVLSYNADLTIASVA